MLSKIIKRSALVSNQARFFGPKPYVSTKTATKAASQSASQPSQPITILTKKVSAPSSTTKAATTSNQRVNMPSAPDHIPITVHYIHDIAHIKMNLPSKGIMKFYISKNCSVRRFQQLLIDEDSSIQKIQVKSSDGSIDSAEEMLVDKILMMDVETSIIINGATHKFPMVKSVQFSQSEETDWFQKLTKGHNLSSEESAVLNIAIQNLEKNWDTKNVDLAYEQTNKFMRDPIISEELLSKKMALNMMQEEIGLINKTEEEIKNVATKKVNKVFWGFWLFSGAQLSISYHCIFNIEWLGWDLVEPLSYTSSVGVAITFMWYMMRNRGLEDTRNVDILQHKINLATVKHHNMYGTTSTIDKFRKQQLIDQLAMVQTEIQALEKQRIY